MGWFWKDKVQEVAPPPAKKRGLFRTDVRSDDALTINDRLQDHLADLADKRPVATTGNSAMDSAGNSLKAAFSGGQPEVSDAQVSYFLAQSFIGHQLCALLAQHWLIAKCCSLPARDAVRHGYEIHTSDGDALDAPEVLRILKRCDKRHNIPKKLREWVTKGKVFGIRIAIFKVRSTDPLYYEYPFNPDAVTPGSYKGIVQVDPYWCTPVMDYRASTETDKGGFYEPTYWMINGTKYHRSHLVIFTTEEVADILKPSYMYGGIPLPQKIMERVYAAERTANEAPNLAMTKRTNIIATDLEDIVVGGPEMLERFETMASMRDNFQISVVDKEDTVTQLETNLSDLDVTIMTQYQLVASIAEVPGTKLLGTAPKGFNATGEFDESMYHESLESLQSDMAPFVERHHQLCMLSDVLPAMRRSDPTFEPVDTTISWQPLDSPTAKEYAEINKLNADTDMQLISTGALDSYDVRNRLIGDKNAGYTGLEVIDRPDDDGNGLPDVPALAPPAPAAQGFDSQEITLITNQAFLDPTIVQQKQAAKDYKVQVTPPLPDPDTQRLYRIVIDGHHSLEAARIDGVAPEFVEAGYGLSDYFDAATGSPLAQ